jgi:hypothetical protein
MALMFNMWVSLDDTLEVQQINPTTPPPSLSFGVTWTDTGFQLGLSAVSVVSIAGQPDTSPDGTYAVTRDLEISIVGDEITGSGTLRVLFTTTGGEILTDCTEGLGISGTCFDLLDGP